MNHIIFIILCIINVFVIKASAAQWQFNDIKNADTYFEPFDGFTGANWFVGLASYSTDKFIHTRTSSVKNVFPNNAKNMYVLIERHYGLDGNDYKCYFDDSVQSQDRIEWTINFIDAELTTGCTLKHIKEDGTEELASGPLHLRNLYRFARVYWDYVDPANNPVDDPYMWNGSCQDGKCGYGIDHGLGYVFLDREVYMVIDSIERMKDTVFTQEMLDDPDLDVLQNDARYFNFKLVNIFDRTSSSEPIYIKMSNYRTYAFRYCEVDRSFDAPGEYYIKMDLLNMANSSNISCYQVYKDDLSNFNPNIYTAEEKIPITGLWSQSVNPGFSIHYNAVKFTVEIYSESSLGYDAPVGVRSQPASHRNSFYHSYPSSYYGNVRLLKKGAASTKIDPEGVERTEVEKVVFMVHSKVKLTTDFTLGEHGSTALHQRDIVGYEKGTIIGPELGDNPSIFKIELNVLDKAKSKTKWIKYLKADYIDKTPVRETYIEMESDKRFCFSFKYEIVNDETFGSFGDHETSLNGQMYPNPNEGSDKRWGYIEFYQHCQMVLGNTWQLAADPIDLSVGNTVNIEKEDKVVPPLLKKAIERINTEKPVVIKKKNKPNEEQVAAVVKLYSAQVSGACRLAGSVTKTWSKTKKNAFRRAIRAAIRKNARNNIDIDVNSIILQEVNRVTGRRLLNEYDEVSYSISYNSTDADNVGAFVESASDDATVGGYVHDELSADSDFDENNDIDFSTSTTTETSDYEVDVISYYNPDNFCKWVVPN